MVYLHRSPSRRRSQDFLWCALFSSKSWWPLLVVVLNTQAETAKLINSPHPAKFWLLAITTYLYNAKLRPLRRSRSFKVTDFSTDRNPIWDFLLKWLILTYIFSLTISSYCKFALRRGCRLPLLEWTPELTPRHLVSRNYKLALSYAAKCVSISLTVQACITSVTDKRTDGRTDGWTGRR